MSRKGKKGLKVKGKTEERNDSKGGNFYREVEGAFV